MTFFYTEDGIELISSQRVDMLAPPPEPNPIKDGQTGFWLELHNEAGEVIYQQQLHPPIRHDYEVFSPEPGAPIRRVPRPRVEGTFDVIVPALPTAAHVTVHGTVRPDEHMRRAPARRLGRYPLERKAARGGALDESDRGGTE